MSVLHCDRYGCESIMCDRYSYTYGYICNSCFDELVSCGINTDIGSFMYSKKQEDRTHEALEAFDAEFKLHER